MTAFPYDIFISYSQKDRHAAEHSSERRINCERLWR